MQADAAHAGALSLDDWIAAQETRAARQLFDAMSATHLTKRRPGFGQTVTPAPGSVLASPDDASWDPEPDYFFHWLRDAALAMEAARLLRDSPLWGPLASWELEQYVNFSRRISALTGAARLREGPPERNVMPAFRQYLRPVEELAALRGDAVRGDVRFSPDGALDITRWSRPQYDGVALRALGLLRCADRRDAPEWAELAAGDLDCIARNASRPCVDIWEEEAGFHLHALLTQHAALRAGVAWAAGGPRDGQARVWAMAADDLWERLGAFRREEEGWIVSRLDAPGCPPVSREKQLDSSVILAVLHAGLPDGPFSPADPLAHGALARLEAHYAGAFAWNRRRAPDQAPLLGRNPADVYFGGGGWPLLVLAAAELRYRLAQALAAGALAEPPAPALWFGDAPAADARTAARLLFDAGDTGLVTVRALTPPDGVMGEQADRDTGAPRSARRLTWSCAAFLTAVHARRGAAAALAAVSPATVR